MTQLQQKKKKQSIFPDFPRHGEVVTDNKRLTPEWHLSLSNLYQQLQQNLSNEGYTIPPLTIEEEQQILDRYTPLINKTLQSTNPPTRNISGKLIYSLGTGHLAPPPPGTPDPGYVAPALKVFIIEFEYPSDPSSTVLAVSWKTVQVV